MQNYLVEFTKGKKTHIIHVTAAGIVPAINEAISKHYQTFSDALGYQITSAKLVKE